MARVRIQDVVVLLPGITGSVLAKDGEEIWALSGRAAWGALRRLGDPIARLRLAGDDPDLDDLGDGVRATRVMEDFHYLPGLAKVDGYSGLRELFTRRFEVFPGDVEAELAGTAGDPANYFELHYDWRRDNRVAARRLLRLVERALPRWRRDSGARDARVLLVAHSMGGLVCRWYLEMLGGWRDTRALVTFGTPYLGSVDSLDYVAHGFKKLFVDITETMRTFTAVYQLLPAYRAVEEGGAFRRLHETDGLPATVDRERAAAAWEFHHQIRQAVERHRRDPEYRESGYRLLPYVGTRQRTLQSARLSGGVLEVGTELPAGLPGFMADGDGTVPRISATPLEISKEYRDTFFPERHGSLQNHPAVLGQILERVKQMQAPDLTAILGAELVADGESRPALGLEVDDLYLPGEPVVVRGRLHPAAAEEAHGRPVARIEPAGPGGAPRSELLAASDDDGAFATAELALPPGVYRVELTTERRGPGAPPPVHDLFEIGGD